MKINHIEVKNFRGFKEKKFDFSQNFTVFVGDNCTGKTALLDALAVGIGSLFLGFNDVHSRHIRDDEIYRISYTKNKIPTLEPQYPVKIYCVGSISENPANLLNKFDSLTIAWTRELRKRGGRTTRIGATDLIEISEKMQQKVSLGENIVLPLIAYYGTGRLWLQKKERAVETLEPGSRMRGYLDCLDAASNQKLMLRWFKTMEMVGMQRNETLKVLISVKQAITNCVEDWNSIKYDLLEDDLMITSNQGKILPFRLLSDGVRNMLAMVADIAYRAAVLNPQLEDQAASQTPGIVLIDEIDLHLHPKWQRKVVNDLRQTFPKIQFIATTHSPFIIQSLKDGELINLDKLDNPIEGIEDFPVTFQEYFDENFDLLHRPGGGL
ncbi:SMC domain protein [Planktothrix serta PCC 8927]|uniref:SMC domain protein n=1 Tax=Planktothrix serta PCC 8927 TaxID=671068 RepID=A0A7Z9DY17_9CYAN|nr:AAA family ATPase [Planktothrix serta]VXD12416.1 SMC domain protein [Planktothrix serta PCC 8927]